MQDVDSVPIPYPTVDKQKLLEAFNLTLQLAPCQSGQATVRDGLFALAPREALFQILPIAARNVHYAASFKHEGLSQEGHEEVWLLSRCLYLTASTIPLQVQRNGSSSYPDLTEREGRSLLTDWFVISVQNALLMANRLVKGEPLVSFSSPWMRYGLRNERPMATKLFVMYLAPRFQQLSDLVECLDQLLAHHGNGPSTDGVEEGISPFMVTLTESTKLVLNPPMFTFGALSATPDMMILDRATDGHLVIHLYELKTASSVQSELEARRAFITGKTVLAKNLSLDHGEETISVRRNSPAYAQVLLCQNILEKLTEEKNTEFYQFLSIFYPKQAGFSKITVKSNIAVSLAGKRGVDVSKLFHIGRERAAGLLQQRAKLIDLLETGMVSFHDPSILLPQAVKSLFENADARNPSAYQPCFSEYLDRVKSRQNDWATALKGAIDRLELPFAHCLAQPKTNIRWSVFISPSEDGVASRSATAPTA